MLSSENKIDFELGEILDFIKLFEMFSVNDLIELIFFVPIFNLKFKFLNFKSMFVFKESSGSELSIVDEFNKSHGTEKFLKNDEKMRKNVEEIKSIILSD